MRFKLLVVLMFLALLTCSDDNSNPTYPFERTVLDVSIAKRCKDGSFKTDANCYLMRWQHPIEKTNLQSYYIWLDTIAVKDSVQNISQSQIDLANAFVPYNSKGGGDSLDLTDLISGFLERDSLHVAIWAKYSGSDQGAVQHLHIYFGDDVSPLMVSFNDSASSDTIWIDWIRPADQRDFYSDLMNGPIAGYNVNIRAENTTEDIRNSIVDIIEGNNDIKYFHRFNKDGRSVKLESINRNDPRFLRFAIIDGKGTDDFLSNNWKIKITGLKPERSYNVSIVAFDSAGNQSVEESRVIKTTDSIQPLIANKFWLYADSGDGLPRLDSNRLILFWPRSLDPLSRPTQIQLNSTLRIPANYRPGVHYREVMGYSIEQKKNDKIWEAIPRVSTVRSGYYNTRYNLESNSMKLNANGEFVSDTLRWVSPGDTLILRIRAVDSSGYYSEAWIDTIAVSKGVLWQNKCPPDFAPIKMDDSVFCMEKLQHISNENKDSIEKNILYIDAKKRCETLGFSLCTEQQWNAACNSGGSGYGIIEEKNESGIFSPSEFLFMYCGVGTGDLVSASAVDRRNKICTSPDGIKDLPGQLQEWVVGNDGSKVIKGSSYAIFQGASRVELAQCRNRYTPTRIRPRYADTTSVYLYRSGSRIDTLLTRDTLRTLYAVLEPSSFPHILLVYTLKSLNGDSLGIDYVNQEEYRKRGGEEWLKVLWQGLKYELKEEKRVLILGTESINASDFFLDPTVGFRCCTDTQ